MFNIQQTKANTHSRRIRQDETRPTNDKKLKHPSARGPLVFADTAVIDDIRPLYKAGIISGVTTNPSLIKKAGATNWSEAVDIAKMFSTCESGHFINGILDNIHKNSEKS